MGCMLTCNGSIKVNPGDTVKRGQVLGLVGNTGNSVAPHLHFHVMDTPSSLASNGLPYEIDQFQVTGRSPGTEAFDAAEANGTPSKLPQLLRLLKYKTAYLLTNFCLLLSKLFAYSDFR